MEKFKKDIYEIIWVYSGLGDQHGGTQFAVLRLISEEGEVLDITAIPKVHGDEEKHAEPQLLDEVVKYREFCNGHGKPKVLILYSWIVPCRNCTQAIIDKLQSSLFVDIQDRVVVYTTQGKCVPHCDEEESKTKFSSTTITFFRCEYYRCKFGCYNCHTNNSKYYCKDECNDCRALYK